MKNKNYIHIAKNAAKLQIRELRKINKVFNKDFVSAVNLISNCKGKVIAAGIGKSGLIARKISATLSSVGISSFYLNPGEANHGDLGQIDKRDILLVFSYSGNTAEIINMLKYANRYRIKIIGETQNKILEKKIFLQIIDFSWRSHLQYLEQLRQVIGLRQYGQKDPLSEFKKEAFTLFEGLLGKIKKDLIKLLFNLSIVVPSSEEEKSDGEEIKKNDAFKKVGRNEKCPCGSGKKFKHCHGNV